MSREDTVYKDYLHDLGILIKEYAIEAKKKSDDSLSDFDAGYLSCFHRIVSLIQQQADAFDIPYHEIGISGIDANEDLV